MRPALLLIACATCLLSAAVSAQDLPDAEARYRAAIALDPTVGSYHASLAVVLLRQDRAEEARLSAADAVRLDPTSPRNRAVFGEVLVELGRWADAEAQLEQAIRYGGEDVVQLERLGRAYAEQEKWGPAAATYRRVLELAPGFEAARAGYATALSHVEGRVPPLDLEVEWSEPAGGGLPLRDFVQSVSAALLVIGALGVLYPLGGFLYLVLVAAPLGRLRRAT